MAHGPEVVAASEPLDARRGARLSGLQQPRSLRATPAGQLCVATRFRSDRSGGTDRSGRSQQRPLTPLAGCAVRARAGRVARLRPLSGTYPRASVLGSIQATWCLVTASLRRARTHPDDALHVSANAFAALRGSSFFGDADLTARSASLARPTGTVSLQETCTAQGRLP